MNNMIIMRPINKLMSHMGLKRKFTLIILVSILGYVPGSYFIYSALHSSNAVVQDEIAGVDYYTKAYLGYLALMEAYIDIKPENKDDLLARAQEKYSVLDALNKDNKEQYQTNSEYQGLLQSILSTGKAADVVGLRMGVDDTVGTYLDLLDSVVSKSQLALDPDLDSYYLMDITTVKLPLLLNEYAMFIISATDFQKNANEEDKFNLLNHGDQLGDMIKSINKSLDKIAGTSKPVQEYSDKLKAVLSKITTAVSAANPTTVGSNFSAADVKALELQLGSVNLDGIDLLKQLLLKRASGISSSFWGTWSLVILSFLLMIYCIIGFIESLKHSISALVNAIRLISAGNLVSDIPRIGHDELTEILGGMSQMQGGLLTMVEEISEVSGTLNCSAHEISSGNNDLSERTQEQASCLVETSASLNNLTQTIKKNASSANEAADLANTATNFAQKGGDAVNQVIETMGDINNSAKKIQEITGVIDGIAFQTNLLALNASVEAARAGEQGRGFAVVASEVRNLAQRSAEAAKQIKGLINDSMTKVASGDAQVKVTWDTMQDIVKSIEHVNTIVAQISTASNEQSLSIEQINIVISQLEGNTQKNAAQVEEVAASAELLKDQSTKLVSIVGKFEIEKSEKRSTPKVKNKKENVDHKQQSSMHHDEPSDSDWQEF